MKIEENEEAVTCSTEGCIDENGNEATLSIQLAKDCSSVKLRSSTGQFATIYTDRFALDGFRNTLGLLLKKNTNKPYATLDLTVHEAELLQKILSNCGRVDFEGNKEHYLWGEICEKLDTQIANNLQ
jgi:hypothetical protein